MLNLIEHNNIQLCPQLFYNPVFRSYREIINNDGMNLYVKKDF